MAMKQWRRTKLLVAAACMALSLYSLCFQFSPLGYVVILKEEEVAKVECAKSDASVDHFRYRGLRLHKNVTATNEFLFTELLKTHAQRENHTNDCHPPPLIVGRFGASEQHLMAYSELPNKTTKQIPTQHYINPSYYFLPNESATFASQRDLVQFWGRQRRHAYGVLNAFGLFDWDHRPDQIHGVQRYAPQTAWLHAGALYPPCLPIFDAHYTVPWTEALRNRTILIVHPFIDTIQQQIPKLQDVWSKATLVGAPSSCLPLQEKDGTMVKFVRARLPVANPTKSWLAVLEEMQQEVTAVGHFDIALLSCGGFGLPLLAHIASLPHRPSGIYVGGALQLYFGIHGARWYYFPTNSGYQPWKAFHTDAWTWPLDSDLSFSTIGRIEDSSYVKPGQAKGN